jgi:hypothetical protein
VKNKKQLPSDLGVRYAFHGKEFMKLDDCPGNYMEINPNEFSTNRKEMWEVWAEFFQAFDCKMAGNAMVNINSNLLHHNVL